MCGVSLTVLTGLIIRPRAICFFIHGWVDEYHARHGVYPVSLEQLKSDDLTNVLRNPYGRQDVSWVGLDSAAVAGGITYLTWIDPHTGAAVGYILIGYSESRGLHKLDAVHSEEKRVYSRLPLNHALAAYFSGVPQKDWLLEIGKL
jgi:hypothetical protein